MSEAAECQLVTAEELCKIKRLTMSWIYQRTGPKARRRPILTREPWHGNLRFDLNKINQVLSSPSPQSSLKTEKPVPIVSPKKERTLKPLW